MKVVLFCGGLGTRIREYSESIPKPMVPIGSQPILWHVMQYYSHYGYRDFILALGYKAGVIKVATAYGKITKFEHKCMEASAKAAIETGCPINTHTTYGTCGLEQAETLIGLGVPADQIAIGHIQRNADLYYLQQVLDTGVYLEIDGTYRIKYQPDSNRIMELRELGAKGYGKRLLLGTDSGKRSYQKAYGAVTGVDFNPAVDGPRMIAEGFDPEYVNDLLINNGHTFFTFRKDA